MSETEEVGAFCSNGLGYWMNVFLQLCGSLPTPHVRIHSTVCSSLSSTRDPAQQYFHYGDEGANGRTRMAIGNVLSCITIVNNLSESCGTL